MSIFKNIKSKILSVFSREPLHWSTSLEALLKDDKERYAWRDDTQAEILNKLLLRSYQRGETTNRDEKLVVVFGKPQVGKTTLILSLMGIAENKRAEISEILRAGIPEGNSSTSTAIVYQHSDDDQFGISEHGMDDCEQVIADKCNRAEFVERLKNIRKEVEEKKRDSEKVLSIYIPQAYFSKESDEYANINILDVPGYESRNRKEHYHVNILLKKYMTAATLNIIVTELNDINYLGDFEIPNGDRLERMRHKYIVITTRSYSMESIANYFSKDINERTEEFKDYLCGECEKEFERIFGDKVPEYYPVDIGQSFEVLLNKKLCYKSDQEYLQKYRDEVFESIRKKIQERMGSRLSGWIKEISEEVKYLREEKTKEVEDKIERVEKQIKQKKDHIEKNKNRGKEIRFAVDKLNEKLVDLRTDKEMICGLDMQKNISKEISELVEDNFTSKYKWKNKERTNSISDLFADLFYKIVSAYINDITDRDESMEDVIYEKEIWDVVNSEASHLRIELNENLYAHKLLKVLNPSNEDGIEIGTNKLKEYLKDQEEKLRLIIQEEYKERMEKTDKKIQEFRCCKTRLENTVLDLQHELEDLKKKKDDYFYEQKYIRQSEDKAREILDNYKKIAFEKFQEKRDGVIDKINQSEKVADKVNYLLLLGVMWKDYEREMIG